MQTATCTSAVWPQVTEVRVNAAQGHARLPPVPASRGERRRVSRHTAFLFFAVGSASTRVRTRLRTRLRTRSG